MNKIRILTIGHSYVISINRAFLRKLAEDPRYEITVVAPRFVEGSLRPTECEPEPDNSRLKLVKIDAYLTSKIHCFFYHPGQLKKIMQTEKYDLVYIWQEPYIFSCFQVYRHIPKNIPFCFFTAQNIVKKYFFPFSFFEKILFKTARAWIPCGELVKKTMEAKGFSESNGFVIPLAVDLEKFKVKTIEQKQIFLSKENLSSPLLIYMGRLTEEKGVRLLMNIISKLDRKLAWSFMFMGKGPLEQEIADWIIREQLSERVKLKFYKHGDVPEVLNNADVLFCPSQTTSFWREQFGRMIVEAFASGLAVVGSDSGEIPIVIGSAGLVVSEKSESQWLAVMNEVIVDSDKRLSLAQAGLLRAKAFDTRAVADQFDQVFQYMLKI